MLDSDRCDAAQFDLQFIDIQVRDEQGRQAVAELDKRLRETVADGMSRFEATMVEICLHTQPCAPIASTDEPKTEPKSTDVQPIAASMEVLHGHNYQQVGTVQVQCGQSTNDATQSIISSVAGPASTKISANSLAV